MKMGFFSKKDVPEDTPSAINEKPHKSAESTSVEPTAETDSDTAISSDLQAGVQNIEAIATVWTKWHMVAAYGW